MQTSGYKVIAVNDTSWKGCWNTTKSF